MSETPQRKPDIDWEVYGGRGLWFRVRVTLAAAHFPGWGPL